MYVHFRRRQNTHKDYIYALYDVQFDGKTIIDTGIPLMALPYDWKLECYTEIDKNYGTVFDCNNEDSSYTYGVSAMGTVFRHYINTQYPYMEVKIGKLSSVTVLDETIGKNKTNYGYTLNNNPQTKFGNYVKCIIIKRSTDILLEMIDQFELRYMHVTWSGATNKNLYIGGNVVETTGEKRRFYTGYMKYLTIKKI